MDMCRDMGFKMDMCSRDVGFTMDSCSREGGSKMDLCGRAGFGCGGRMVVVESECRGWVVMRIGIRSFVERERVRVRNATIGRRGNGGRTPKKYTH